MKTPSWFLKRNFISYILWPVSLMYYLVSKIVFFVREQKAKVKRQKAKVICVGNIFAGGVGKTPIVREIAKHLHAPVVMRGYKRQKYKVERQKELGDEGLMLQNSGLDVYVGNRKKNIEKINKSAPGPQRGDGNQQSAIIMDDGFQNPTLPKDVSIIVFDEKMGFGNGFMLPAGPLREPVSAIKRADAIIVIRNQSKGIRNQFIRKLEKYNKPIFCATNKTLIPDSFGLIPYAAFAGIGYPQKFFDALPVKPARTFAFPDHYQYNDADITKLLSYGLPLVTTEKDWVRLSKEAQKKIQFAKLETKIEPRFWEWLQRRIHNS